MRLLKMSLDAVYDSSLRFKTGDPVSIHHCDLYQNAAVFSFILGTEYRYVRSIGFRKIDEQTSHADTAAPALVRNICG